METPEPAGAASAALNTTAKPVQQPVRPPAPPPVTPQVDNSQPADSVNDVAPTRPVDPESRVGNFIDTTA